MPPKPSRPVTPRWVRLNELGRDVYPTLLHGRPYLVLAEGEADHDYGWYIEAPGHASAASNRLFVFKLHFEQVEFQP